MTKIESIYKALFMTQTGLKVGTHLVNPESEEEGGGGGGGLWACPQDFGGKCRSISETF